MLTRTRAMSFRILLGGVATIGFVIGVCIPSFQAAAVGCTGSNCTGLNPETMGCGADALTGPTKTISGGKAENRYSVACNAEWERTRNQSGIYKYAAGSIRYGCANYCYAQRVRSPAKIASGYNVYTAMKGPDSTTYTRSCGRLSDYGPISIPVPVNESYCSGVG